MEHISEQQDCWLNGALVPIRRYSMILTLGGIFMQGGFHGFPTISYVKEWILRRPRASAAIIRVWKGVNGYRKHASHTP